MTTMQFVKWHMNKDELQKTTRILSPNPLQPNHKQRCILIKSITLKTDIITCVVVWLHITCIKYEPFFIFLHLNMKLSCELLGIYGASTRCCFRRIPRIVVPAIRYGRCGPGPRYGRPNHLLAILIIFSLIHHL